MNIIARIIIEIFQAVFEKDAEERRRRQQQPPPVPKQARGGGKGKSKARNLDAWIEDLVDDELPQTPSSLPPVPKPAYAGGGRAARGETFAEHAARTAARFGQVDDHVDHYLGEEAHQEVEQRNFQLPGHNPAVQLVLANEILGKPKGLRR